MQLKVGTDCTGIGSPEQALKNLNVDHKIVFACEKDKYARQTYSANFHPQMMFEDMTTRDNSDPELNVNLYIAGIPCQAFSLAGKRMGELDPRGLLFYNFYDFVKQRQPDYFIIENVKGLLSDNNGKTFNTWLELLAYTVNRQMFLFPNEDSLLYHVHWEVLNTKDFGIPQNRERVFVVGIRSDLQKAHNEFRFPTGYLLEKRLVHFLQSNVHEKYYLTDTMLNWLENHSKKKQEEGCGFKFEVKTDDSIANAVNQRVYKMGVDDNYVCDSPVMISNSGLSREYEEREIVPPLRSHNGSGHDNYIIHNTFPRSSKSGKGGTGPLKRTDGIAYTVDPNNHMAIEAELIDGELPEVKKRIRRLTPTECFRLQGFPDEYVKPVSDTQLYRQAGNSITVAVIQAILKNLLPCT